MLWLKYGVFLGDTALIVVNSVGALMTIMCLTVYYIYCPDRADVERRALYALSILASVFAMVKLEWFAPRWVGLIAMVASVTMFAAPLVALVDNNASAWLIM